MTWLLPVSSAQAAIYLHAFCWLCAIYVSSLRSKYDQLQEAVKSLDKFVTTARRVVIAHAGNAGKI